MIIARYILAFWLALAPLGSALATELYDPPAHGFAVTPSDTVSFPETTELYIGHSAAPTTPCAVVTLTMAGTDGAGSGGKVTLKSVPNGLYPLRVTQVWATGLTTCDTIVAFY
jgi:hypothetical protein